MVQKQKCSLRSSTHSAYLTQTPPGDYPNSSSCSLDESSNYDNAITIEKDKCVADRLLSELRMRTILDMRRDENATKIELKRIQVDICFFTTVSIGL